LPPYSPDLNPIEMAFSKLKAHLRKAAEHTIAGLLRRIGRVVKLSRHRNAGISCVTPDMFKHERNPL
jgi:transposase